MIHGFAGGDPEYFGGQTNGALESELLVLCAIDEVFGD
jgi:hypothetical protein